MGRGHLCQPAWAGRALSLASPHPGFTAPSSAPASTRSSVPLAVACPQRKLGGHYSCSKALLQPGNAQMMLEVEYSFPHVCFL